MNNALSGSFDYYSRETKDILTTPPYPSVLGEGQDKTVNGATTKTYGWELQLDTQNQITMGLDIV